MYIAHDLPPYPDAKRYPPHPRSEFCSVYRAKKLWGYCRDLPPLGLASALCVVLLVDSLPPAGPHTLNLLYTSQ